jgi:hypothetical protein
MHVAPEAIPRSETRPRWRQRWPSVAVYAALVAAAVAFAYRSGSADASVWASTAWIGTGLALGLAALACRPRGVEWDTRPVGALLAWLATRWRALAIAYAVIILLWSITAAALGVEMWPLLFDALFSHGPGSPSGDRNVVENAAMVVAFIVLQLAFISGAGRITVRREPPPSWKLGVSIALFAVAIGLAAWGTLAACVQLTDRIDPASGRAGVEILGGSASIGVAILAGCWLFWLGVGWLLARGVSRETALGRMIAVVFVGSWIEFAVALPVELVTRDRTKDCPCASGSWVALICSGPLLLWAIGPSIFLLYRYEWQRTLEDPAHARRVLQRKSHRAKARQ